MASSNKTPNYNLPQYAENDTIEFTPEINTAFSAIDAGMKANATNVSSLNSAQKPVLHSAASQTQLNALLDTTQQRFGNHAKYVLVVSINVPDLTLPGGEWTIEGLASGAGYEWQTATTYIGGFSYKKRRKSSGTWSQWEDITNATTLTNLGNVGSLNSTSLPAGYGYVANETATTRGYPTNYGVILCLNGGVFISQTFWEATGTQEMFSRISNDWGVTWGSWQNR